MLFKIIISLLIPVFFCSCVSIGVEEPKFTKADNVIYQTPSGFTKIDQDHVDIAWKNLKNGNVISYLSECGSSLDLSHTQIRDGILVGIHNKKISNVKMIEFNSRKALSSIVTSNVDGIDIKTEILILKKNNCTFILTYLGVDSEFIADHNIFKSFLQEFIAP